MADLESLPPDQRAVLQLVLRQGGRSYAELAALLKITPEAVRDRAHAALTALAGEDDLPEETRARVADYLLGQGEDSERLAAYAELTDSAPAHEWARTAGEGLAPLARDPLPEIPELDAEAAPDDIVPATGPAPAGASAVVAPAPEAPTPDQPATGTAPLADAEAEPTGARRDSDPPPSRLGGLALLAGVAILAAAIVLALVINRGNDSPSTTTPVGTTPTTPTPTTTAPSAGTTTTPPASTDPGKVVAQINLKAPQGAAKPVGIVQLKRAGKAAAFVVVVQGLTKPATGFVSVWLEGAKTPPIELVAIDGSKVKSPLTTFAPVPRNLAPYRTMLVTLQPGSPRKASKTPGQTLLSGPLGTAAKG